MSEIKKVSLEQLIKKKLERDGKRDATKEIYVKSLDGEITFKNPSDTQRIEFADKTKTGSYVDMMEAYGKLIYDCCPMLHSKELQESIEVDYPYDTVKAIFDILMFVPERKTRAIPLLHRCRRLTLAVAVLSKPLRHPCRSQVPYLVFLQTEA